MRRQRQIASGAYIVRSRGRFDDLFWLAPENRLDGISPFLFVDPRNNRYSLNNQFVKVSDILALSSATGKSYVDANGVLRFAGSNEVRIDNSTRRSRILLEGPDTSITGNTNNFSDAQWAKDDATVIPNAGIGPDGTNNAWKLVANAGYDYTSGNATVLSRFISVTGSLPWVWSIFVKAAELTQFRFRNNWTGSFTTVDLTATTDTANSVYVGNGWHRCFLIYTPPSTSTNGISYRPFGPGTADGVGGVLIYGGNIVQSNVLSSYIEGATGSAVTRTADICPFTVAARTPLLTGAGAVAGRARFAITGLNFRLVGGGGSGTQRHIVGPTNAADRAETWNNSASINALTGGGLWTSLNGAGACSSWGPSGRRIAMNGSATTDDANLAGYTDVTLGTSTGLLAGQVMYVDQIVGWTLSDRASAAAVQAQARIA